MLKLRKILLGLLFCLLFSAGVSADYQVNTVQTSASIAESGRTDVSMTVTLTFSEQTDAVQIPVASFEIRDVSAGDDSCSVEETEAGTVITVKNKSGFAGTRSFQLSYVVPYASVYSESDETYTLDLISSRWERAIETCVFQVVFPKELEENPTVFSGYWGELSAAEYDLTAEAGRISGTLTGLIPYESVQVRAAVPEGYFTTRSTLIPGINVSVIALVILLVWLLSVIYWRARLWARVPDSRATSLRPSGVLVSQLPGALDGKSCDIGALVIEWASRGYLRIGRGKRGNVILQKRIEMGTERSTEERRLFYAFFRGRKRAGLRVGAFAASGARYRSRTTRSLWREIVDRRSGNPVFVQVSCQLMLGLAVFHVAYTLLPEGFYTVLAVLFGILGLVFAARYHRWLAGFSVLRRKPARGGLFALGLVGILAAGLLGGAVVEAVLGIGACTFSAIGTATGPRRTEHGTDIAAQTRALRRFYQNVEWKRVVDLQHQNSRFFQEHISRAVALNVGDQFAKRYEQTQVAWPEWLGSGKGQRRTPAQLMKKINPIVEEIRAATE